jgi:flavin prenyltransferase
MQRIIVGMTGATGAIFGVRLVEELGRAGVETHLVMSKWAERTVEHETPYTVAQVKAKAAHVHSVLNQAAPISSGSFRTAGMVIAPCSAKTLAAIAHGFGENLIERAADVVLKEGRKLVLMVRETPLSAIHLENMLKLARMGTVILPPMPAFYNRPESLDHMVDHLVARVLDQFDVPNDLTRRWEGEMGRLAENPTESGR